MIRKAVCADIPYVAEIYTDILNIEAAGKGHTGWVKGIYPSEKTALASFENGDLYVMEEEGKIVASAKINKEQVPAYASAKWEHEASGEEVLVLHTLVVSPKESGKGYASAFVAFYEEMAREMACPVLRMDTNAKNTPARSLYRKLNYREAGIVPCNFNGIKDVMLVCLEKKL